MRAVSAQWPWENDNVSDPGLGRHSAKVIPAWQCQKEQRNW